MAQMKSTTISSDNAALDLLKKALEDQADEALSLNFKDWPQVHIELKGPHYEGTITAGTAQALIGYQKAFEQAYIRLAKPDAKRLTNEEKRAIAIKAKVEKGSTLLTIDFNEALTNLSTQLLGKMTPTQILIAVLGLGIVAGGTVVAKAFVNSRAARLTKDSELQQQLAISKEETKRLQVVTEAMRQQPKLHQANLDFDDARDDVLRSAADATSFKFEGVQMNGQQAATMARSPKAKSIEVQLNGIYIIRGVTWPLGDDEVILDLRGLENSLEFKASLSTESLLQRDKDLLAKAEWERIPLYLSINAKKLRDDIVSATVVGFDWDKLRAPKP